MTLTPHPLLVLRSKNSRAISLLSLRAFMASKKGETYLHEAFHFYVGLVDLYSALLVRKSHSDMLIGIILQEISWDVGTVKNELKEEEKTEGGVCLDRSV
jgi:hypothetical protein